MLLPETHGARGKGFVTCKVCLQCFCICVAGENKYLVGQSAPNLCLQPPAAQHNSIQREQLWLLEGCVVVILMVCMATYTRIKYNICFVFYLTLPICHINTQTASGNFSTVYVSRTGVI